MKIARRTAAVVMVGAYLIDRPAAAAPGTTAVALSGPGGGAVPKIGTPAQDFTVTAVDGKEGVAELVQGTPGVPHVRRQLVRGVRG